MADSAVMEEVISGAIVRRYFEKLQHNLAIVGCKTLPAAADTKNT